MGFGGSDFWIGCIGAGFGAIVFAGVVLAMPNVGAENVVGFVWTFVFDPNVLAGLWPKSDVADDGGWFILPNKFFWGAERPNVCFAGVEVEFSGITNVKLALSFDGTLETSWGFDWIDGWAAGNVWAGVLLAAEFSINKWTPERSDIGRGGEQIST